MTLCRSPVCKAPWHFSWNHLAFTPSTDTSLHVSSYVNKASLSTFKPPRWLPRWAQKWQNESGYLPLIRRKMLDLFYTCRTLGDGGSRGQKEGWRSGSQRFWGESRCFKPKGVGGRLHGCLYLRRSHGKSRAGNINTNRPCSVSLHLELCAGITCTAGPLGSPTLWRRTLRLREGGRQHSVS